MDRHHRSGAPFTAHTAMTDSVSGLGHRNFEPYRAAEASSAAVPAVC
jgi:hypothetical protein